MILDDIVEKRKEQLQAEMAAVSFGDIKSQAANTDALPPHRFRDALKKQGLSVIAEVKKASPSKSVIRADFNPLQIAVEYQNAGADALSCLTEEYYFQGSSHYLKNIRKHVEIPILRKDFIIHPYQIYEAKVIGADAILLIAAILPFDKLVEFKGIAEELGLDSLIEVHDLNEMQIAVDAKSEIIGINNRNLKTFEVKLSNTKELANHAPKNCVLVSESGITSNKDMKSIRSYGADAVLIGETLMRSSDIAECLKDLRKDV